MSSHSDPERVVRRVVELLGGVERTRVITDQEFSEMNQRWSQNIEAIGRILRSHLYVEHYLIEYIEKANPRLGAPGKARLTFAQKVDLLDPNDERVNEVKEGVKHLNKIRNRLAHGLNAVVTVDDAAVFLRGERFAAVRFQRALPGVPSNEPMDILEEFAQYASHAFTGEFSRVGQALAQAIREYNNPLTT